MENPANTINNELQTKYTLQNKHIYLELEGYKFFHSPYSLDPKVEYNRFIGRERVINRLRMILNNSQTRSGAYLITGFRGMGKTSVVRKVIKDINKENRKKSKPDKFIPIEISLSQDNLHELDVFRYIAWALYKEIEAIKYPSKGIIDIRDRLHEVNNRISSELKWTRYNLSKEDRSLANNEYRDSSFAGKEQSFPLAGPKEIEWELIKILISIEKVRNDLQPKIDSKSIQGSLQDSSKDSQNKTLKKSTIPEFIFIFDELDKIEPNSKFTLSEKESEDPYFDKTYQGSGTDKIRTRRETIASLLANLKSFLNTARAKFIFIGGREMYDASLADIADRDSFYSSIFHDVIYVESFLKDGSVSQQGEGLTLMTEKYLCKLLLPISYLKGEKLIDKNGETLEAGVYSLRTYHRYLLKIYSKNRPKEGDNSFNKKTIIQTFNREEIARIIYALQNFVIYLTYRSNGTPKKLTSLFEDQLIPRDEKFCENPYHIRVGKKISKDNSVSSLFLHFNPSDQYVIGLTSVIYRPYIINHSRYQKMWGDKLLFSTSYIIDHILKFHSFGFSWRNLELIPELITINKAPQLRVFIKELLQHYSNLFVRSTVGGIFRYRFFNKASNEIKYVSKISELCVAAFNFTLDESLMIKRHYHRKLRDLKKAYESYKGKKEKNRYIHAIGFVHGILGDLHYYDQEYDDAIIQYSDAIQDLQERDLSKQQVILLIYNKLKLGLTLEKIQSFETAFTVYRELIEDVPGYFMNSGGKNSSENPPSENPISDNSDSVESTISDEENSSNQPFDNYRGFRLISQAYLAILQVIEKLRSDGITDFDILENEKTFFDFIGLDHKKGGKMRSLPKPVSKRSKLSAILISNYYNNLGSILFYKNKNFPSAIKRLSHYDPFFGKKIYGLEKDEKIMLAYYEYLLHLGREEVFDYNPSLSAYTNYRESLRWLLLRFDQELNPIRKFIFKENKRKELYGGLIRDNNVLTNRYLFDILILLSNSVTRFVNTSHLYDLGNLLSKIGDSLLTFVSPKLNSLPSPKVMEWLFAYPRIDWDNNDAAIKATAECYDHIMKKGDEEDLFYTLELVFFTYRLAAQFYLKAGQILSYAFQYKKILYIIRDYLSQLNVKDSVSENHRNVAEEYFKRADYEDFEGDYMDFLKDKIALPIIKAITWGNKTANRPMILKYKDIFGLERTMEPRNQQSIITNVSSGSEVWEAILLISDIQLKMNRFLKKKIDELDMRLDYVRYSPYSTVSSKFVRILEYNYKADINKRFFTSWGFKAVFDHYLKLEEKGICEPLKVKDLEVFFKNMNESEDQLEITSLETIKKEFGKQFCPEIDSYTDIIEYLISDAISNLAELIHTLNVYGTNYMASYSYLGYIHTKLASWCKYYRFLLRIQGGSDPELRSDPEKGIFQKLEKLLGRNYLYFLEIKYHYELAIQYFHSSLQLHKEGKAYKETQSGMFYLEDDFNDNLYHFCASLERYKINTNNIRGIINDLKIKVEGGTNKKGEEVKGSKFYIYNSYIDKSESDERQ